MRGKCAWLQIGYKNFENTEKINIFRKYDSRKPRKHAICHTWFSQPNPLGWQNSWFWLCGCYHRVIIIYSVKSRLSGISPKAFLYGIFLLGMMVPIYGLIIPLFSIFKTMGLLNNHLAVIIPQIALGREYS